MNPSILFIAAPVVLLAGILALAGVGTWPAFWGFIAAAVVGTLISWALGRDWVDLS